ncbi:MAG: hypothetical protein HN509_11720 [Halobacteriovoraceae bacterium]|jgi:hypothetical protein|nr:hypothetical protein [Halobacteriovoraceae bacterium]MBT5093593.1 hypothetical protein [Halobacteriovoraceae bacterium]
MANNNSEKYAELIARISKKWQSPVWWASYISSKNRFYPKNEQIIQALTSTQAFEQLNKSSLLKISKDLILELARFSKHLAAELFRTTLVKIYFRKKVSGLLKQSSEQTLLKSFSYDHCFVDHLYQDKFWGALPEHLENKNEPYFFLVHPVGNFRTFLKSGSSAPGLFSYQSFFRYRDLFWIFRDLFKSFFGSFPKLDELEGEDYSAIMGKIMREEHFAPAVLHSLILYYSMRNLSRRIALKQVLYIFEGNYWERLFVKAFRDQCPSTVLTGYQHNIISRASYNYFLGNSEHQWVPLPDRIISTGQKTAQLLSEMGRYGTETQVIAGCALRYGYLQEQKTLERTKEKVLLVAMEGLVQSVALVDFALEWAGQLSDWKIIIRTHPIFPIAKIKPHLKLDLAQFQNVEVSANPSLLEDFKAASVVLYWGSTVALEAISLGLPVAHLDLPAPTSPDPLFDLEDYKWVLPAGQNPVEQLEEIHSCRGEKMQQLIAKSSAYIDSYFGEVNPASLDQFLAKK